MGSTEELANWAVKKENKLSYIQTIQHNPPNRNYDNHNSRNSNSTFRPNPTPEPKGDPMDLDASTKKGYLNLLKQEYERRKKENLCFKCGRKGHSIGKCLLNQKRGPGQPRIRDLEVEISEETPKETLNEESPQ